MSGGYMGKILFVDLSTGVITEEALDDKVCRDFIGVWDWSEDFIQPPEARRCPTRTGKYTRADYGSTHGDFSTHRDTFYSNCQITLNRRMGRRQLWWLFWSLS
jgi:hypothetical protein